MNKVLFILLLFCFVSYQHDKAYCYQSKYVQDSIGYVTDFNLALNLSKETGQDVLLIFSASWCQFCQNLKNDLSILNHLENKIICVVDADEEKKLSKKFKIKTLPSSFILNKNGETISSHTGYKFDSYNDWLKK